MTSSKTRVGGLLAGLTLLAASLAAPAASTAADARGLRLGQSFEAAASVFRAGEQVAGRQGGRDLLVRNVDWSGVRWREMRLVFSPTGALTSIELQTRGASYEEVKAKLGASGLSGGPSWVRAADGLGDGVEARLCGSDDGVSLVFSAPAV